MCMDFRGRSVSRGTYDGGAASRLVRVDIEEEA